jgi:uncharacterized protein YbjT (DUF2867 family)
MKNSILVTGSTGTIGRQVVKQLSEYGVPFRASVQPTSKVDNLKESGAELVEINFRGEQK